MAQSDTSPARGWGMLLIGLVLGVALGVGGTTLAMRLKPKPNAWVATSVTWTHLPSRQAAGALPQTFILPPAAYDYGGISAPLGPLVQARPGLLRVEVEALQGRAGVSLATPDGQRLISPERSVTPQQGRTTVYLPLAPDQGPAAILLRNYEAPGQAGRIAVHAVSYARLDQLSPEEIAAVNQPG